MRALLAVVLVAVATTGPADNIGTTTATIHGTVDPEGVPTSYHFEYGTTDEYGLTTGPGTATGDEPVEVQAELTGLTADTEYHYRLVAGDSQGEDRTFRTAPNPLPPAISSQRTPDRGVDAATVTAAIDANGTRTTFHVEYGTTARYGSRTPDQDAGAGPDPAPVAVRLTGLQPRTRYHYRFVATSAAGTVRGRDRTFTSRRLPTAVSLSVFPRRVVTWGRGLTLGGRVSGIGVGRTPLSLQVQRFPFDAEFSEVARKRAGEDGGYAFQVAHQWTHSRYRVVTRTRAVAVSPVVESLSAVLVGRRVRHTSRRRARIDGSVLPAVRGRASLQRRSRGRWATVQRKRVRAADALRSRVRFKVRRQRRTRRYRIVVLPRQGGAHVRGTSRRAKVRPRRT